MFSFQKTKTPLQKFRISPSQAILFAPAAILLLTGALIARNMCSRPVIRARDFLEKNHEVVIYLKYPPAYPFKGNIEAILEVRQFPDHHVIFTEKIGEHRWTREAIGTYQEIEWNRWDRILIHSKDRVETKSVRIGKYCNIDPSLDDTW